MVELNQFFGKVAKINVREIKNNSSLRNLVFLPVKTIVLFIYLFIYASRLLLRNFIRAKLKEFRDLQNQILAILKTFTKVPTREIKFISVHVILY